MRRAKGDSHPFAPSVGEASRDGLRISSSGRVSGLAPGPRRSSSSMLPRASHVRRPPATTVIVPKPVGISLDDPSRGTSTGSGYPASARMRRPSSVATTDRCADPPFTFEGRPPSPSPRRNPSRDPDAHGREQTESASSHANPSSPASHANARPRSSPVSPRSSSGHSAANASGSKRSASSAGRVSVSYATRRWNVKKRSSRNRVSGRRASRPSASSHARAAGVVRPSPAPLSGPGRARVRAGPSRRTTT